MNDDLVAYLQSIDPGLLRYLDADHDLAVETVAHLYRYSVCLLQGLIEPEHVAEDWGDFFCLADAFVLAYGSKRLGLLGRRSALLAEGETSPGPLSGTDRMVLVELVRELGSFVSAGQSATGGEAAWPGGSVQP